MEIKIITVGQLKEKYWREAADEYLKRLRPYAKIEVLEVAEERVPDNPSPAEIELGKEKEGERIVKLLSPSYYVIALAIQGKMPSSADLAARLNALVLNGKSRLAFIIGGSYGLSPAVLQRSDFLLSFSSLTFPHQLMRVILLEQIYRSFKILKNEPYHK